MIQYIQPKVVLNDGTEFENTHFGQTNDHLWITFTGKTMAEVFPLATDTEKLDQIVGYYMNRKFTFRHFTILDLIRMTSDEDGVEIRLRGAKGYSSESEPLLQDGQMKAETAPLPVEETTENESETTEEE